MASQYWRASAVLFVLLAAAARAEESPSPWPPFLPSPETFSPPVTAAVTRVWADPTFSRTVRGGTARVPFHVYVAFVDSPEVTAAAARHLDLANYEVRVLGADWYEADDHDGARGFYRVLVRDGGRRVILSWGEHSSIILGTIRGSALTVLHLEPRGDEVDQGLTAHVRIENRFAATLARLFVFLFGAIADRKLLEGFEVAAKVAEWGVERPHEFCAWLASQPLLPERREPILSVLPACH